MQVEADAGCDAKTESMGTLSPSQQMTAISGGTTFTPIQGARACRHGDSVAHGKHVLGREHIFDRSYARWPSANMKRPSHCSKRRRPVPRMQTCARSPRRPRRCSNIICRWPRNCRHRPGRSRTEWGVAPPGPHRRGRPDADGDTLMRRLAELARGPSRELWCWKRRSPTRLELALDAPAQPAALTPQQQWRRVLSPTAHV